MLFNLRSGATAVLAVVVASVVLAASAPAALADTPPKASGLNTCRIEGFPGKARPNLAVPLNLAARARAAAHASNIVGTLSKFVTEKAVGVKIERYAVIGMSGFLRMIDSSIVTPDSPEQQVLAQLNAIYLRLGEVEARVERVGDRVNQVIGELREGAFDNELKALCKIASGQMDVYRRYRAAVKAGVDLGRLLAGPNYAQADLPTGRLQQTPRVRALDDLGAFQRVYESQSPETQFATLRHALIADPAHRNPPPLQTLFGRVLMSRHRFLTRTDSERMRELFREFSEFRALASWMGAEYWASQEKETEEGEIWASFLKNTKEADAGLPKYIPPGAILDVGTEGQDTARRRPLWLAPVAKDLTWLPGNDVGGADQLSLTGVPEELSHINSRLGFGKGWHAPTKTEVLALIHKGCSADPQHRDKPLVGCSQAVPGNSNIAAYLQGINPDKTWQQIFCQSSVEPKCPAGAGPKAVKKPPHPFIWTDDRHSQRVVCGRRNFGPFNSKEVDRRFWTHAGFLTLGPIRHEVFPHLPQKSSDQRVAPGSDLSKIAYVKEACENWFKDVVNSVKHGHKNWQFEGVLLANRYTNAEDINPVSNLDLMAQFPK